MTILDKIIAQKKIEVERLLASNVIFPEREISRPSLYKTLRKAKKLQVISEMKRASPSKGLIAEGANPVKQAIAYYEAGAACISVLTDNEFFKGSFEDLAAVADVVPIALLCKDFIIHPIQIDQAKSAGASVILLIVAALDDQTLGSLYTYANELGLDVLVEVHSVEELQRALAIDAKIIGVNNRDLRTFEVDLAQTELIAEQFPFDEERVFISESGIWNPEDAERAAKAGASAVLVGESLMRSDSVKDALRALQVEKQGIRS
ncbi:MULTISPECIES: indole-3-glycerol phosphate synthase TrpC [Sporosarcina]|uniref:Indole-3-glycerol phosphate synthase n=1 Tax=Sporosarcina newyorkensis TaxID=759851 RepID=A0A1T4YW79_9BACL|nr:MULTISPECIES: indole-3-glycerol phosphate synthase TrpC [Sporosarcina]MBY0222844.1 indole-3-glycerol phosphate synthase TrpC [Sporosarcina aquimarina]SKB06030.1 indole-3-glycerol phosphate synthase [Sporosarcina newyorkensis]